jgi:colanic acid biosynthesis protein WcaH
MPIPCIDLVILKNDKILLIKRKQNPAKDQYWFPGGRILRNESFKEAAIRLAKSEVGLTIEKLEDIGTGNLEFPDDPFGHGFGTHAVTFVYRCITNNEPTLDDNHSVFVWWNGKSDNHHSYITHFADIARNIKSV